MKKIIVIAMAAFSFTAASAQNRNDKWDKPDDRYPVNQQKDGWYNKDQHPSNDYGYNKNNGHYNDRERQAQYERMNRQYDKRINDYRNDRSLNRYERERRIRQAEQERQQQSRSFGKGLIVGGAVGVLLGVVLSH